MAHVGQADPELFAHRPALGRRNVLHVQHDQRGDDHEKRQRVEQEAGVHRLRLAVAPVPVERQREGERHRPEHARDVELDRVQRHGVRQIFLVDERRNQRLIRRAAERLRDAGDERQRQDVPDLDGLEVHQQRERGRGAHLDALRDDQGPPAIVAVGEHAADEREQDDRQLLQERVEPEEERRRIGQRNDQPVLRDDLHPRADARRAGAEPLDAEVAIGERREHAPQRPRPERGRGAGGGVGRGGCLRRDRFGQEISLNRKGPKQM